MKILSNIKEALGYSIPLTLYLASLTFLFESGGFLNVPYGVIYISPFGLIAWPVTFIIAHFISLGLFNIQRKYFLNFEKVVYIMYILLFIVIGLFISMLTNPAVAATIVPVTQICSLSPEDEKDNCYRQVAYIRRNESLCDLIKGSIEEVLCYDKLSIKKKNVSICNLIRTSTTADNFANSCERRYHDHYSDYPTENCEQNRINNSTTAAQCYYDLAFKFQNESFCGISSQIDKYIGARCWLKLAQDWNNVGFCNNILSLNNKEAADCFYSFASKTSLEDWKMELCNTIKGLDESVWQRCQSELNVIN